MWHGPKNVSFVSRHSNNYVSFVYLASHLRLSLNTSEYCLGVFYVSHYFFLSILRSADLITVSFASRGLGLIGMNIRAHPNRRV